LILCCIRLFRLCRKFFGKLFLAIICIVVHYFCFFFGVKVIEYIWAMWYLRAAILSSMGWFDRILIVVSVLVGLRNMSISRLVWFRVVDRSRKFIQLLFSYVGLSFMLLCIWFIRELIEFGEYVLCRRWLRCRLRSVWIAVCCLCQGFLFMCMSSKSCRNISDILLEIGDPMETTLVGKSCFET
jgi:hypothetical protein